jgi:hypothetical protein
MRLSAIIAASLFCIILLSLQVAGGLRYYFSMYASKDWHYLGYALYACLFLLQCLYFLSLYRAGKFVLMFLQGIATLLLLLIAIRPFTSLEHLSLVPYMVFLQPCVFLLDALGRSGGELHAIRSKSWCVAVYVLFSPVILIAVAVSPLAEKAFICAIVLVGAGLVAAKCQQQASEKSKCSYA